jgi:hypothetical protein
MSDQRPIRGETTLAALQAAYQSAEMRRRALIICEQLDEGEAYAPAKLKQQALVLARYYVNRAR